VVQCLGNQQLVRDSQAVLVGRKSEGGELPHCQLKC